MANFTYNVSPINAGTVSWSDNGQTFRWTITPAAGYSDYSISWTKGVHTFYSTKDNDPGGSIHSSPIGDEDVHLEVTFIPVTYTLTFNANGGSVTENSRLISYGSAYGNLPEPFRAGYTFDGWYTAATGGTSVASGTVCYGNTTLYAHWTPVPTYTITYKPGTSGIGSQQTQTKTKDVALTLKGAIFTRTGYTQTGWATSDGGTKAYDLGDTYSTNAALTLYPFWTVKNYTVTFVDWNGQSIGTPQTVSHGGSATAPSNPTRRGYTFAGWDKTFTNVTGNLTIQATYTPNTYSITLHANGGTIASGNVTQYLAGTGATLPTDVTKTGCTFGGWYNNAYLIGSSVDSVGNADFGNKEFYAKFTTNTYSVSLHTNGGTINRGNVTSYTYLNGATLPTDVSRQGFAFGGWFASSDFSGERVREIGPDETGNKAYYAKWGFELTVTFKDHDGTVLKTETVIEGDDATPPQSPTREGYDFAGWDGDYTDVSSDIVLTATYDKKILTVTFKDFDGTVLKTDTVEWGESATPPADPEHIGYTFTGWSREFANVRESIEVVAIYNGAVNYKIRGRRWQRLYTAAKATPVYAAESDASLAARTICDVPWKETSGNFVSCLTAHPGTAETDEHNLSNREYFDAAAFCAGHENGMHRIYAQATCYRFALPESAVGKSMKTLSLVVAGDPYLRDGARIAVLTNSTGVIPTDCTTCRTGNVHAEGVAKRTVSEDGLRWFGKTDRLQFTPTGGLTLGSFLYVFVILENYAYSRGEYVEGSACIQPNVEIGLSQTVEDWSLVGVNLCYGNNSHSYDVCKGGVLPHLPLESQSGIQFLRMIINGDHISEQKPAIVTRPSVRCIGLRTLYAAFYEGRLNFLPRNVSPTDGHRTGAAFVINPTNNSDKEFKILVSSLLIPFAVPISFRADRVHLYWGDWTGSATEGGRFNVWIKRNSFISEYPIDVLRNPKLYDATDKNVEGFELLGVIDATTSQTYATLKLDDPLGGYVATILLTAFVSLDDMDVGSIILPQGVATSMDISESATGYSIDGWSSAWKPDITLFG